MERRTPDWCGVALSGPDRRTRSGWRSRGEPGSHHRIALAELGPASDPDRVPAHHPWLQYQEPRLPGRTSSSTHQSVGPLVLLTIFAARHRGTETRSPVAVRPRGWPDILPRQVHRAGL